MEFTKLISILLHSRTQAHTYHLQTNSYAEHMALNGYYSEIGDLVDGLVESYQGKYEILSGYKSYDIVEYQSTEMTVKFFRVLCEQVDKLRHCCEDSYIQNQIDTIQELINSTLYKLRFLN
jgi:hypothetical protein